MFYTLAALPPYDIRNSPIYLETSGGTPEPRGLSVLRVPPKML